MSFLLRLPLYAREDCRGMLCLSIYYWFEADMGRRAPLPTHKVEEEQQQNEQRKSERKLLTASTL